MTNNTKREFILSIKHYWIILILLWSIHNLEEGLTMSRFMQFTLKPLPITSLIPLSLMQKSIPLSLLIATLWIVIFAFISLLKKYDYRFIGIVISILGINAIQHIVSSIFFLHYTPGVITAVLFNLPFSIYSIRTLFKQKLLKNYNLFHLFGYGAILYILSLLFIWLIALGINM